MKGLKLPGEIESKNEESQMYLKNNLNKITNNFFSFYDKYQIFFQNTADDEEESIDYKILSSEVKAIKFLERYSTLYKYLNHFFRSGAEEISKKDKSFLEDLLKWFILKKAYATPRTDINNIEKAYSDLVLNNKKIDDVFYKNSDRELSNKNKNIFQEAKNLFDFRVKIYQKLILEEENLKFEENIAERKKLGRQRSDEIAKRETTINPELFKYYFKYSSPRNMYNELSDADTETNKIKKKPY